MTNTPFTIKGSTVNLGERYSGPPAKMYPVLRDLAERDENTVAVAIEMDTIRGRYLAQIEGLQRGGTADGGIIVRERPTGQTRVGGSRRTVRPLDSILAFRVVRIVITKNDERFRFATADYPWPAKQDNETSVLA